MNPALWRILYCYLIIGISIYVCEFISFWCYPFALVALGSQFLTLGMLGHEATHGHLHKERSVNEFIGRYFCHFPVFASHSHFSMTHLIHHRELGQPKDPDFLIYQTSFSSLGSWLVSSFWETVTLKLYANYLIYFNGANFYLSGKYPFKIRTDYGRFFAFWFAIFLMCLKFKFVPHLFYYGIFPGLLWMPWIKALNSFQHLASDHSQNFRAYNIVFRKLWIQEILFPVNINFHEVHHLNPSIPYHKLPESFKNSQNTFTFSEFSKRFFNSQMSKTS